jgi:hypothetical protein
MDNRKKSAELIIAHKELAFQNEEKEKRVLELITANKDLAFQYDEKEKCAAELTIANKELVLQSEEKEERASELIIANKELIFQNAEKEKRAEESIVANKELKKAEDYQKEYIQGLEEMIFITSHKVRQPIAHILGLSYLLDHSLNSPEKIKQLVDYMKESALSLDSFTEELTTHMNELEQKGLSNKKELEIIQRATID